MVPIKCEVFVVGDGALSLKEENMIVIKNAVSDFLCCVC